MKNLLEVAQGQGVAEDQGAQGGAVDVAVRSENLPPEAPDHGLDGVVFIGQQVVDAGISIENLKRMSAGKDVPESGLPRGDTASQRE